MDNKILQEVSKCKNVEDVLKLAKDNNYEISKEKAEELFNSTHTNGELTDSELNSVSGGGCSGSKGDSEYVTRPECYQVVEFNSKEEVVYLFNEGDQVTCCVAYYRDGYLFKNGKGYISTGIVKSKCAMYHMNNGKKAWVDQYKIEYTNSSNKIEAQSFQRNDIVVK